MYVEFSIHQALPAHWHIPVRKKDLKKNENRKLEDAVVNNNNNLLIGCSITRVVYIEVVVSNLLNLAIVRSVSVKHRLRTVELQTADQLQTESESGWVQNSERGLQKG